MKPKAAATKLNVTDAKQKAPEVTPTLLTNQSTESRKYRVRVRTTTSEYEGMFFSPYPDRRLNEVLNRKEGFINLKHAKDRATGEEFPFIVIGKSSIETIKVIEEWT